MTDVGSLILLSFICSNTVCGPLVRLQCLPPTSATCLELRPPTDVEEHAAAIARRITVEEPLVVGTERVGNHTSGGRSSDCAGGDR